ncbi:hypothetical protein AADZ91_17480 [Colwelliaceae bacterium 6441]
MFNSFFRWWKKGQVKPEKKKHVVSVYCPLKKYYVFNETGNIMLCTTEDINQEFDIDIKDAFIDISVFFSAMTKALAVSTNPDTGKPFSIYNSYAVEKILNASGMFVEVQSQEDTFESKGVGETLGNEFIEKVLSRKLDVSKLGFSRAMFRGMKEQQIDNGKTSKNGQIFFVCEKLMGLPQITAILVSLSQNSVEGIKNGERKEIKLVQEDSFANVLELGERNESLHQSAEDGPIERKWLFTKKVYIFISPKVSSRNITNFNNTNTPEYEDWVEGLSAALIAENDNS